MLEVVFILAVFLVNCGVVGNIGVFVYCFFCYIEDIEDERYEQRRKLGNRIRARVRRGNDRVLGVRRTLKRIPNLMQWYVILTHRGEMKVMAASRKQAEELLRTMGYQVK